MGAHSATLAPATRMALAWRRSLHGLAERSMPRIFLEAAAAETMQASVVIDVRGARGHARKFAHEIRLFIGQRGAANQGKCVVAIGLLDAANFSGRVVQSLVPRNRHKTYALFAQQGSFQAIRMFVLQISLDAFGAEPSLVEGKIFPGFKADYLVVFDLELDAALLPAKTAVRLHDAVRFAFRIPAQSRSAIQCRTELRDDFRNVYGWFGHIVLIASRLGPSRVPCRRHAPSCASATDLRRHVGHTS